jgi:hypothetical protein
MVIVVRLFYFSCFVKDKSMTEDVNELLCGDDVNIIYGDDWYFEMAKKYLSHEKTSECQIASNDSDRNNLAHTTILKDAA